MSRTYEELLKEGRSKARAKGYVKYFADYYAEGYAKGYMETCAEGRAVKLMNILAENGLIEEMKKATEDWEYRESLYIMYNL